MNALRVLQAMAAPGTDPLAQRMLLIGQDEVDMTQNSCVCAPMDQTMRKIILNAKFNTATPHAAAQDTLALSFSFTLPSSVDFSKGQDVWFGIGNVISQETLTKGKGVQNKGNTASPVTVTVKSFTMTGLPRSGATPANTTGTVKLTLTSPNLVKMGLYYLGITNSPTPKVAPAYAVEFLMLVAGVPYRTTFMATYKNSKGQGTLTAAQK